MAELNKKKKHDHKLTDWLKVIIFAIIMLAPFFAILTECCFAVFNEQSTTAYSGTITNVFYDAIDNVCTQPVFAWTNQTGMYTVINSMTTDLEMSTSGNILATLLTYWMINTAIYIIFDIVIWAFTKITHILGE